MKTLIKLIIAAVVVNAAYRGGSAYLKYYQFKDETQQMVLFGQAETVQALASQILNEAVKRGDILVFKFPEDPTRDFIKRVIGLPGDTVELKGKTVHINGKPLEEPYVRFLFPDDLPSGVGLAGTDPRRKYGPVTVPADMFFMMGDNRDNSEDSRFWGFMPRSYIKGKALFVYFSFGDANGLSGALSNIRWSRMFHQIH